MLLKDGNFVRQPTTLFFGLLESFSMPQDPDLDLTKWIWFVSFLWLRKNLKMQMDQNQDLI